MLLSAGLSQDIIDGLIGYAKLRDPQEMCGLLFIDRFHPAQNRAQDPYREFLLSHEDYLDICSRHSDAPWALVHSHPGRSAAVSAKDCRLMDALEIAKQDLLMVVVGLNPVEIRGYRKRGDVYSVEWTHVPPV